MMSKDECGHDHAHDDNCNCEDQKITISLDGEEDVECSVIGVFEAGEREYIALLPTDDEEIMIFRYAEDKDGVNLGDIETDEEYETVAEVFYEVFISDEDDDDFDEDDFDEDDDDIDDELDEKE